MTFKHISNLLILIASLCWSSGKAQTFQEISAKIGINTYCQDSDLMGGGVLFFDFNNDYYPDLYIIGGDKPNTLLQNNWDGTFSDVSHIANVALPQVKTIGAAAGDFDNDGDDDLIVSTGPKHANVLLQNNGDGTFSDISQNAGITELAWSTSITLGDYNLDGLLDIYVNNYAIYEKEPFAQHIEGCQDNFLYENRGNNQFENVATALGLGDIGCGLAVAFTDCDQDYDQDLFVANDFGLTFEPNELYTNAFPEERFHKTGHAANIDVRINAMGIAIGDYDEDGDFDYYFTNIADNPFFENKGSGTYFEDVGITKGVSNPDGTSWGTVFLDFDNDSYLDLAVANGQVIQAPHQNDENRLFRGSPSFEFEDISEESGFATDKRCRGLSVSDLDNDGDLDLLFGVVSADKQSEENALLYQNNAANENNWSKIKLLGKYSNRNGFGSHLRVVVGERNLVREADGGSSYLSQHYGENHFGLGHHKMIDSLIITWPGGYQDIITKLPVNQALVVEEGGHWYSYKHQELTITVGDSIFLAGSFQKIAGVYHHFPPKQAGEDKSLIITRLSVKQPAIIDVEETVSIIPNPFRNTPKIKFTLKQASQVQISIIDMVGRQAFELSNRVWPAGQQEYIHQQVLPRNLNGLCVFRIQVDEQVYLLKAIKLD